MIILGICQDKGLMDLLLQDARRLPAGINVETFGHESGFEATLKYVRFLQADQRITLLVMVGGELPSSMVKQLADHSDAAFTYYRNNADRWYKFLKNKLKPVSVDYRTAEFWFMLGSIYTALVTQSNTESEMMFLTE